MYYDVACVADNKKSKYIYMYVFMAETWFCLSEWMEADLNARLQMIVRKGRDLGGLNYCRNPAYVTRERSVISPEY